MPLDMSIYQNLLRPPKSVAELDAEAVQGQTNRLALQSGQAQLQDRQRAIDDGNKLRQLVSGFGQDQGANYNMLLGAGQLDAAQKYVKSNADVAKVQADAKESAAKTAKSEQDVGVRSFDSIAQTMGALRNVPGGATKQHVATAVQHLVDVGILRPDMAGKVVQAAPDNPAEMPQWLATQQAAALTAKDQLPTISTRNLGGTTDTLSVNPVTQEVKTLNSAPNSQTPDSIASNARIASEGNANRANALAVQDKITAREPEPVSGTKLAPEDITTMAQQYIAGDKSVLQGLGRGTQGAEDIRAVRAEIGKQLRGSNLTGADQAAKIAEYAGMTAGMRATGNISARVENAVEEAAQLAPLALAASKDVARSGLLPFGKAQIMFDTNTNDPNLAKFATANMGLATAYASAMARGNKPTVSDMDHARGLLSTAKSQPAYEATVQQMMQEMQAAKRAPRSVRGSLSKEMSGRSESEAPAASSAGKPSLSDIFGK